MVLQIPPSSITNSGLGVNLGTADSIYVVDNIIVASTTTTGISGTGSNHQANIYGSVFGTIGLSLGDSATSDSGQRVYIGTGGNVGGTLVGVNINGFGSRVENHGEIQGTSNGLIFSGTGGAGSRLFNYGVIDGGDNGVSRGLASNTNSLVINNFGTITAEFFAFNSNGANAVEKIYNRGTMTGDIALGLGNDTFDGRGGVTNGLINGGDGNDTFVLGAGAEEVTGGAGIDLLDFHFGGAVRVALDGSFDTAGAAAGDLYSAIENVIGSTLGGDTLVGSSAANMLSGLGGIDNLAGGSGNDRLIGGYAKDRLSGGAGNDVFVFNLRSEGGDLISDFSSNVTGNNDSIQIKASAFGGDLVAGALAAAKFYTSGTNVAHDGDDRFIFRNTDKTLWFDANGSAAGAAVLVADLQASANLTALDIILV